MRVLVCGGRDYKDKNAVFRELSRLAKHYGRLVVIQGGATGADKLARDWCFEQPSVHMINEPADWDDLSHPDPLSPKRARRRAYRSWVASIVGGEIGR